MFEGLLSLAGKRKGDELRRQMELMQADRKDLAHLVGPQRADARYAPYAFRQRRVRDQAVRELERRAARGDTRFHVVAAKRGVKDGPRGHLYQGLYRLLRKDAVLYRVYFRAERTLTEDGPFVYLNGRWLYLLGLDTKQR